MQSLIISWPYLLGPGTKYGSSWSWRACLSVSCYQRNWWVLFPATRLKFWYVMLVAQQERYKMMLCHRASRKLCKSIKYETLSRNITPHSTVFCNVCALQFLHFSCMVLSAYSACVYLLFYTNHHMVKSCGSSKY